MCLENLLFVAAKIALYVLAESPFASVLHRDLSDYADCVDIDTIYTRNGGKCKKVSGVAGMARISVELRVEYFE